ncbi:helix-turn-helix transcriptional regulator [Actinoallomurus soli]|uniref:helix-turn-helix transcriptional regulator n=1 Tax=Actinoallomurus soli TaxID=2952535 RepID=UPI0027E340E0|nr:AAA family ATPase [Actinoallomurus soli]
MGRRREYEVLAAALDEAAMGDAQVVLVGGEAGVGKTRLVERFADGARDRGVTVLTGACVASDRDGLPLAPILMALRGLIGRIGTDPLIALCSGLPDLARLLPEPGFAPPGGAPAGQARLFHQFAVFVQRLGADHPVVIIVEDLHWADEATRLLLDVLARNLRDTRVLIIATYRSDDLHRGHPLRPFLAEFKRVEGVRHLELGRLGRAETAELIAAALGGRPSCTLVRRVFDRSGGNAFLVEELLRAQRGGTSFSLDDSLRDLLISRIECLPDLSRQVIRLIAIERSRVPHPVVAAVAGLPDETLLDALRAAIDAHVLVADGEGYDFRHALVREALVADLLPGERMRLHRAYAVALETRPELLPPERLPGGLAYHWAGAGEPARALPALVRAAAVAKRLNAHAERWRLLRRALDLSAQAPAEVDQGDLAYEASHAAWLAGEYEQGLGLIERALAGADRARRPERTALSLAHRGRHLLGLGRAGDAVPALEEAERLVPAGDSVARGTVLEILASALIGHGDAVRGREIAEEALRIARTVGDGELQVAALTTQGAALARDGRYERAVAAFEVARTLAGSRGDLPGLARACVHLSGELWAAGLHAETVTVAREGLAAARASGLSATLGALLAANLGMAFFAMGLWDDADAVAVDALEAHPSGAFAGHPRLLRGELALARGDLTAAARSLSAACGDFGPDPRLDDGLLAMARLDAEIAFRENRVDHARRTVARALGSARVRGRLAAHAWALVTTGAMIEAGVHPRVPAGPDEIADLTELLRSVAADLPTDTPPWRAHAAQFAAELDSIGAASPLWHDVVAAWEKAGNPYLACHARRRAAEAALAMRDDRGARSLLTTAAKEARDLGASILSAEIEALARSFRLPISDASGAPVKARRADPLGLTSREREVLRLLTEGESNRGIGARLFISEKTASVHVSRIIAKLGVTSRGEAAATAHRLRLFAD